ncbi:MAG: hypothetical protein Q8Q59_03335 [Luteolibacter sp.]|jgi:hypothetical protein|nr:hypothetical protein [Luteolibacter sp.]
MKKKIHLGKKTLMSLEIQITTILTSLNRTEVRIDKLKPVRHNTGNFVLVTYHTVADPGVLCSQYCAHQKVGDCCDVWLESPPAHTDRITNTCAA